LKRGRLWYQLRCLASVSQIRFSSNIRQLSKFVNVKLSPPKAATGGAAAIYVNDTPAIFGNRSEKGLSGRAGIEKTPGLGWLTFRAGFWQQQFSWFRFTRPRLRLV